MLNEQIAKHVGPSHLDIAFERQGNPKHPTLLLVMGLANQLVHWPLGFVEALVARELQVLRFDNRDAGRSSHCVNAPAPDLLAALKGDSSSASYTLSDMAADSVGLLDALGIDAAHVVGASMGAGIAQTIALEHPTRVRSLTSMMWTTGAPDVGQMHPSAMRAVFGSPLPVEREAFIVSMLQRYEAVASPKYPVDPRIVTETIALAFDRGRDDLAVARQGVAVVASGDRTERLRALCVPTLVLHGLADTMCDPSGGRATAAAIPGAELVLIEGMGHNLPPQLWSDLADRIAAIVRKGETPH